MGAVTAVDDVSFAVEAGEIFGILGLNGAGKTTTVECGWGFADLAVLAAYAIAAGIPALWLFRWN